MKVLWFVFMVLSSSFAGQLISSGEIETLVKRVVKNGLSEISEEDSKTLHDLYEIFYRPEYASANTLETYSETRMTIDCIVCRSAFAALFDAVREGQDDSELTSVISFFCLVLGIENETVCHGAVGLNMPIITHIIRTTPQATPATFCGLVMQDAGNPNVCPFNDPRFEWEVDLPAVSETVPNPERSTEPLTIAVITDAHLEPLYEAFGVADCGEPTCCRKGQTPAQHFTYKSNVDESVIAESIVKKDGEVYIDLSVAPKIRKLKSQSRTMYPARQSRPAGYWGDFNCDTPIWAYDDVIERIAEAHKNVDVVYYVGDTIDHGVWETTYELINEMNLYTIDKIRKTFGDNVPVVPTIGNHEAQPTNQFAPSRVTEKGLNTTWLYEALARKWDFYLTDEAKATLRDRGDFSIQVRPGLRAIALNNNVAYKFNWWLVYDPTDAKKHLDWLVEELYSAEQAGDKVHILAHIPPGVSDLTAQWTREYNRIVNRFSSTITAEFNGHTHSDEFKIFYDAEGSPINVAWGAGSVTAFTNYNLNYKIATFSPETLLPLSITNYVYNLTEANLTPNRRPHWFQLYDMKNSFELSDLSASSMDDLTRRMVTTQKHLLDLYAAFFSKISDARWPHCNESCKLNELCKTVVTVLWQRQRCDELVNLYHSN
ncbi:sphingomyelin phosphodiesterase-like [Pectinophora gossypiella]|uniref:sphingomyelin phosphodiesterase-like n=1 Tax=Pectinophora gossypiella TaxID=13191 RepID=UPI00214F22E1|nr:sphingomyelin phosphodiesterase-like [Pectinophora gossypiella]